MIEYIFKPCKNFAFTFPAARAELDPELAKELKMNAALKRFAKALAEQYGCAGISIHGIAFTRILERKPEPEPY